MARIKAETGKHMGRRSVLPAETVQRIRDARAAGRSLAAIAETLNAEGVPTAAGGTWHASTVSRVLNRVGA